jgi:glycosyltransferase involved in cell wall biosynthesis
MYRFVDDFFGTNYIINKLKVFYFDFIVRKSLINADRIVSVSKTTKNDILTTFGFDSVHIPEDSNIEFEADMSLINKFNLLKKNYFFYCGNNRPHKNIDFIRTIFNNNLDLPPLVLAGKGHQSGENVIATGVVSEEELIALYESAIAFVFPSKYEGFGLPVLESLRLGIFVIASKIPAFLEFDSENIFFFELNNTEEFMSAIDNSRTKNFINNAIFFNTYDKSSIYKLNDIMLKDFIK